jgi:transcriptional regulator with XRE-family HTH domain
VLKREVVNVPQTLLIGEQVTLLPDALRAWRKERAWSQRELARRAACSEGLISTIEAGYRQASLTVAQRIASALGVNLGALGLVHVDVAALVAELPEAS